MIIDDLPRTWPQVRLDLYPTAVLLTRWALDGQPTRYPVAIEAVVAACAQQPVRSGLLPPDTLFWQQQAGQLSLGLFIPARSWAVQTANRLYPQLPFPPLLFVGRGQTYHLFALKDRPTADQACLYQAPCPNVYRDGRVCPGDTPFPTCTAATIRAALTLCLEGSLFNGDLARGKCQRYPDDVRRLWTELAQASSFPLTELVPTGQRLADLLGEAGPLARRSP